MPKRRARTYIVLGVSGSGKDTQAGFLLRAITKARRISTGDGLRAMAKKRNAVGRYVRGVLRDGRLLPAWAPIYLWLSEFVERLRGDETTIFTSGPRRVDEAELLDAFCRDLGRDLPVMIHLNIPHAVARERLLSRRRGDDTPKVIAERLKFYEKHVRDVVRYYRRQGRCIEINGNQTPERVWSDIRKALRLPRGS